MHVCTHGVPYLLLHLWDFILENLANEMAFTRMKMRTVRLRYLEDTAVGTHSNTKNAHFLPHVHFVKTSPAPQEPGWYEYAVFVTYSTCVVCMCVCMCGPGGTTGHSAVMCACVCGVALPPVSAVV